MTKERAEKIIDRQVDRAVQEYLYQDEEYEDDEEYENNNDYNDQ